MRGSHHSQNLYGCRLGISIFFLRLFWGESLSSQSPTSWKHWTPSRSEFLSQFVVGVALVSTVRSARERAEETLVFPLRFLPNSGCWGLRTTLSMFHDEDEDEDEASYDYLAVVDTGSPFLTAPGPVRAVSRALRKDTSADTSMEQYGASRGDIEWRQADVGTWIAGSGIVEISNMTVGVVSPHLIQETGGIFCGLIQRDDHRPTWLQQVGNQYTSLRLDMATTTNPSLVLSSRSLSSPMSRSQLRLFNLSSYGPDLHHYAVLARDVIVEWRRGGSATFTRLQRPIVVVLDTGLTGCIFHDSLATELGMRFSTETVKRIHLNLPTISGSYLTLTSDPKYWRLDCFHLPWFHEDLNETPEHKPPSQASPHIIAVGATFWTGVNSLTIDTISQEVSIDPKIG
jgi:hypothetical protein